MTITDLIQEFEITYDLGSLGLPGFEEDEIKKLLELSQYRVISQRLQGNNAYQSKFPDTNKRIDDLSGLISTASKASGNPGTPVSFTWAKETDEDYIIIELPFDYLHILEDGLFVKTSISVGNPVVTTINVEMAKEISMKESLRYNSGRNNLKPYIKNPVFHFIDTKINEAPPNTTSNRKLKLLIDSDLGVDNVVEIKCMYIRKPVNLTTVTDALYDFNDDVYHEIVAGAVDHAISIVSPNKSQINQQQLNKSE